MKHNTSTVIAENDDDDGEGNNAKYTNVYMEPSKTYILTLRCYDSYSGNSTLKITGNTPNNIKVSEDIRLLNT